MLPVVGLFIAFIIVVILLWRHMDLGLSLLIGAFLVGMTSSPHLVDNLRGLLPTLRQGIFDPLTVELLFLVALVTILAHLLDRLGFLKRLLISLEKVLHNLSLTIAFIPSLIGALILPGGAILSAPIIKPIGEKLEMGGGEMATINIFYRHLWYFSFPYMPSLIVAASLGGIDLKRIVLMQLPIVFIMLLGGYLFLLPKKRGEDKERSVGALKELLIPLLPLIVVILLPFSTPVPFLGALLIGIFLTILMNYRDFKPEMLMKGINLSLLFGVLGIMIFKSFINETQGVNQIIDYMVLHGISPLLMVIIFPFLIGLLTGNHMGAITISYPFLLPFFQGESGYIVWNMVLFISSFFGYFISPFHLCFVLTAGFFNTTLKEIYRTIFPTLLFSLLGIALLLSFYLYLLR